MKILLACAAGMSTSLLEKNMNDYAKSAKLDVSAKAYSVAEAKKLLGEYDVILVGPQVRFEVAGIRKLAGDKPVDVVPPNLYAMGKGKEVVEMAMNLLKKA